ncbi:MAG: DM13 domain-containing protein, partial [Burkholderiales bacterium]
MKKWLLLAASHLVVGALGFALGIYVLPILIAPEAPPAAALETAAGAARYTAHVRRDLKGSELLHWGEGIVSIGPRSIAFQGRLAPGPDYKLYLSPEFVETKDDFERIKASSVRVGDVRTFENFIVSIPEAIDVAAYKAVVVWCERFSMFITAGRYR